MDPMYRVILDRLHDMEEDRRTDAAVLKAQAAETLVQVKLTNGRVTELEKWRYGKEAVKAALGWRVPLAATVVGGVTVGLVVGIILKFIG